MGAIIKRALFCPIHGYCQYFNNDFTRIPDSASNVAQSSDDTVVIMIDDTQSQPQSPYPTIPIRQPAINAPKSINNQLIDGVSSLHPPQMLCP